MFRAAVLASILLAAPGVAAAHYQAEPVAKPAESKFVLRDTIWTGGEAGCAAGKSNSRPAIVCAVLAGKVGALRSFSAGGEPLDAAQLEKCNARAD